MKKVLFSLAALALVAVACKKPNDGPTKPDEKPVNIEIVSPDDLEVADLDYENQGKSFDFEWESDATDADWSIVFSLDESLSNPKEIAVGKATSKKLTHADLDNILNDLGVKQYNAADLYWTIKATIKSKENLCDDVRSMALSRFLSPFIDSRENHSYRVCKVSDPLSGDYFIWLADNLRETKYSDGTPIEGELSVQFFTPTEAIGQEWVDIFGGYYTWIAAVRNVNDAVDGKKVQGVCPTGWHMPTKGEFDFLINNCTAANTPAKDLKDKKLWADGAVGDNTIGFNMAGAGYIWEGNKDILEAKSFTAFWMSTIPVEGDVIPWNPPASEFYHQAYSYSTVAAESGMALYVYDRSRNYSVRCVLDK